MNAFTSHAGTYISIGGADDIVSHSPMLAKIFSAKSRIVYSSGFPRLTGSE